MGGSGGDNSKSRGMAAEQQNPYPYGTFQGVANYPPPPSAPPQSFPPQPAVGFPQPVPPPGYSPYAYQSIPVQGYIVADGRPIREPRLPCCGLGFGWLLFISGFILGAIPWYMGALFLLFARRMDHREKPGYVACLIASILATIAITLGVTKGTRAW